MLRGGVRWLLLFVLGLAAGGILGAASGLRSAGDAAVPVIPKALREGATRFAPPAKAEPRRSLRDVRFAPPLARAGRPRIAVVIDDLGLSHNAFARVNALPGPLTLAFLPYGPDAQEMLDSVRPGHEVILHLPTEPVSKTEDAGPDMLRPGDPASIEATLALNLAKLSGFKGVNNHTGSRFTADTDAMSTLLAALNRRGLYFLDSVTTGHPVAHRLAQGKGYRVIERDVFLDSNYDAGATGVKAQLAALEDIAIRDGQAVAIGHPYAATLEALGPWLVTAQARGFELVTAGDLAGERIVSASLR
ncbi:divergent polysaccharide deacetylase family protein [Parvularcula dongshanensis]|uniref:Divergent polysaccharide deacetylase family protein n=1 Tax=Parvularcula dongshanensis TaxID=1173995 RepID=A0A840I5S9_9PROT|nr:divergent polysaccharide deacetylase family protein [Parvularcula dongshanensis]MBB4659544.1 hypothetical protein [Parvularcula dongshanensis]